MVELIFARTFPEIVLTDEAGRILLDWYAKYRAAGLQAPKVITTLMEVVNHKRKRSTIISLDSAEMYTLVKWYNFTIAQGGDYFKPAVLQKIVDLVAPYAHPVGPVWQYTPEYREAIDEYNQNHSKNLKNDSQPKRHVNVEI